MIRLSAPTHTIKAKIYLGGSKSINNRLLILNELFQLNSDLQNLSSSEDTFLLQKALAQLKNSKQASIHIGHAGSDLRFLTALLAITEGVWDLTGSDRLKERPIAELVRALRELGADIAYLEKENFPPLKIKGKKLKGGTLEIDSSISSQFVSALLLIAPALENGLSLNLKNSPVSRPYIDMTLALLTGLGVQVEASAQSIRVEPAGVLIKTKSFIESDWSSASYWYSMCALAPHSEIELFYLNKSSLQADAIIVDLYKTLGVETLYKENSVLIRHIPLQATSFDYDFTNCPDIAQSIAPLCFALGIPARLHGLKTLRLKESDRIEALKTELEKLGASIKVEKDSLYISGNLDKTIIPQPIATYNDHRMALAFAPLALLLKELRIQHPSVIDKSYPGFWEDLKSVGFNVNLQP